VERKQKQKHQRHQGNLTFSAFGEKEDGGDSYTDFVTERWKEGTRIGKRVLHGCREKEVGKRGIKETSPTYNKNLLPEAHREGRTGERETPAFDRGRAHQNKKKNVSKIGNNAGETGAARRRWACSKSKNRPRGNLG